MRKFLIISFIVLIAGCAVGPPKEQVEGPPLVKTLSLEEKVGQMFMIRYSGSFYQENSYTYRWMKRLIEERKIGGVIQFVGSIHGTVENLNELRLWQPPTPRDWRTSRGELLRRRGKLWAFM